MGNVITIDGPSGAGKSTVSRILASKIGYCCLDTGAMYRAVALAAKRRRVAFDDGSALEEICQSLQLRFQSENGIPKLFLGEEDISAVIRNCEFDMLSSTISSVKEVRENMKDLQRRMALHENLVAEGRDMGTIVFPSAKRKFFLTASLEARAHRRYQERITKGEQVTFGGVRAELEQRDHQDETRPLSPLEPAEDAVIIDSTGLSAQQVVHIMMECSGMKRREGAPL